MPSAPYWKLRRLAARAKRVQARRAGDGAAIAAYGATLPAIADAYVAAYDAAVKYESTWKREMAEGRTAIGQLVGKLRTWLPLVSRDVAGFAASDYVDRPSVPDDVIADAERLIDVVEAFTDSAGEPLSYRADLLTEINIDSASVEWSEAEAADAAYQSLLAEVRKTGAAMDNEIQMFRRTLRATVGSSDKDFQKLRSARVAGLDEDDDANTPDPPTPVGPAPPDGDVPA